MMALKFIVLLLTLGGLGALLTFVPFPFSLILGPIVGLPGLMIVCGVFDM